MNLLPDLIEAYGLTHPATYVLLFAAVSILMLWRLEAMLDHGLEGTALGTLITPYCSGLGNLLFVYIMAARHGPAREVLTNSLVNNVTNLTLLLGLPAVCWGLAVMPAASGANKRKADGDTAQQITRLSLLFTLAAVLFFTGAVWALGQDGRLDRGDGSMLIGLFFFWQCFQVFDVLKHNVRRRLSFGPMFYLDTAAVLACAYGLYVSIDWLVEWLFAQGSGFISVKNLGWLSGWLMVLPNAILALYWGWKRRADIVYTSQVGDGHICIPLCLGLFALWEPVPVPRSLGFGLQLLFGAAAVHSFLLMAFGGLPRWAGWALLAAYGWFVWQGLLA